jgi:hypothetical protein
VAIRQRRRRRSFTICAIRHRDGAWQVLAAGRRPGHLDGIERMPCAFPLTVWTSTEAACRIRPRDSQT